MAQADAEDLDDLEDTAADGVSTQAEYESLDNWKFNQEKKNWSNGNERTAMVLVARIITMMQFKGNHNHRKGHTQETEGPEF